MNKTTIAWIAVGIAAIIGFIYATRYWNVSADSPELDAFAQCVAEKGAVMYGADWCPHCQNEKKAFGDAFRFIPYVECPDEPSTCIARGINGYPTWIFSDGRRFEGEQGLERLSRISGCELPPQEK